MADTETEKDRTEADDKELVSKKKTNGLLIWRWFGFKVSDVQQKNVFCRECCKPVPAKSSSTSNLFHHLQQRHKVQYEECVKNCMLQPRPWSLASLPPKNNQKQTTLQNSLTRAVPYERKSEKWREITKAVAYHIAKDMVPIARVEQAGFVQPLKTADPRYQLPSRNYFAGEVLPKMYTEVRVSPPGSQKCLHTDHQYLV